MDLQMFWLMLDVLVAVAKATVRKVWKPSRKTIHGEIALVTGAGHGMGRLLAMKLAALGAKIIVVDKNESSNLETAALIRKSCSSVYSYTCDLGNKDQIKKLANAIKQDIDGDVSILVNNAGVSFGGGIASVTDKSIQSLFDVNIMSHFWLIREFLPDMMDKNHGHIVALASIAGRIGLPFATGYSSTKHAVVGYMDALKREMRWLGKHGIKTTYACPSFVDTGFAKGPAVKYIEMLDPEYVVDKIMEAILTDQPFVDIPFSTLGSILWNVLPVEAQELIIEFQRPPVSGETMVQWSLDRS